MRVLLLQLFWFSFAAIGFAELALYFRFSKSGRTKPLSKFLAKTHPVIAGVIALATGLASFAPLVVLGCLLQLNLIFVEIFYWLLLAGAGAVLFKERKWLLVKLRGARLSKNSWLVLIAVGGLLAIDYCLALHSGGVVDGDARFELAQTALFRYSHLTFSDPIYGKAGVPPTVYSASVLHALMAVASKSLHASAGWVWFYSYAFFRLIIWLSLFAVLWEFLNKKVRASWSYAILLLMPFMLGSYFEYGLLHNRIAIAWTAIFILGLKQWLETKSFLVLSIGAVLIASSHPLNAFMAAGFLALVCMTMFIKRRLSIREMYALMPILVILVLPMLLYFYYPHGITQMGFKDGPISGSPIVLHRYGPFFFNSQHSTIRFLDLAFCLVLAFYLWLAHKLQNRRLRLSIYFLIIMALLVDLNPLVVSLFGYGFLIWKAPSKSARLILFLLTIFFALIAYNPLVLSLVHGRIPLWSISRFVDFNVFGLVAWIIGFLAICVLPLLAWSYRKLAAGMVIVVVLISVTVLPSLQPTIYSNSGFRTSDSNNKKTLDALNNLQNFRRELSGQIVFSDDKDLPVLVTATLPANVFIVYNEANVNPAVNIKQREACAVQLNQSLNPADLRASGITRIIVINGQNKDFERLLVNRPDIGLQKSFAGYAVYSVKEGAGTLVSPNNICAIKKVQSG